MNYPVVKAKHAVRRALRENNNKRPGCSKVIKKKKFFRKEYRKAISARRFKNIIEHREKEDFMQVVFYALLASFGLGLMSVYHPDLRIFAIITSLFCIALLIDLRIKQNASKQRRAQEEQFKKLALMINKSSHQKNREFLFRKIPEQSITKLSEKDNNLTEIREFPFRKVPS